MADGVVAITAGSGTPIRVLTGLGASLADQQVMTVADSAGNLLGTTAAPMGLFPSTNVVTVSAAAAAGTATLPAAGAGLFHYITSIRIERTTTAATTGAASSFVTGGANHGLIFQLPSDTQAIGYQSVPVDYRPTTPLRSTAANTATTVTTPAVTATTYRITVTYYTGP